MGTQVLQGDFRQSAAEWIWDLGFPGFVVIFWETADLSTPLRSGRDDKFTG